MRGSLHILHRWAGLTIALALIVTGLTGAILPFQRELAYWLAPDVWHVEQPSENAPALGGLDLARRVEAETGGFVSYIPLNLDRDRAQAIFVGQRPDGAPLAFDEVFADPYTGAIRARVRYADLRDGPVNWMPFLLSFHYSLAAGEWGRWLLGVAALVWMPLSLIGLVLSFPMRANGWRDALRRWTSAATIRRERGGTIVIHDLHRAAGLWLWPVMLVFAWSAVAFNLDGVHSRVQGALGARGLYTPVENPQPAVGEPMPLEQALAVGQRLMRREAERRDFAIRGPEALSLNPYARTIGYYARTSLDGPTDNGSTAVWFDQVSGHLLGFRAPFGETPADATDKAFSMLHTASVFGWPYRVFVSLFGVATATMATAGVVLWFRRSLRKNGTSGMAA
jgi:uncharacterized iron-regulated membrane protein